ncbi:hypothetical protein BDD43_4274 [Mucilaginibacter gracilis]|uniref:MoxR-vWA-beta-propeller ternary system domain-containing protein n=1 Tax=Mucilaginibacter gracilis TaxID=423350 RepID=A0A495J5L9_9SPHI|nr:hypothetical protein [Mucilaginibacter gracilis]RKR84053.1 hypothetical protein BDD43_4274 [Mucilaginibacter gracilis]
MKLSEFLTRLFSEGVVDVPRELVDFEGADLLISVDLIRQYEAAMRMEMPAQVPELNTDAALWAAQYLFRAIQLVLLRELEAEVIPVYLSPYGGEADASAIYSVDLLFRHLRPLFQFSSGISPDDPLVLALRKTAASWPFSSVGFKVETMINTDRILNDSCLRLMYLDRIIAHRDRGRLKSDAEITALTEVTGMHQELFWPGLELAELKTIK